MHNTSSSDLQHIKEDGILMHTIVLAGLMGNSHAFLFVQSLGTQSDESEIDQTGDLAVKLHAVQECHVIEPESF